MSPSWLTKCRALRAEAHTTPGPFACYGVHDRPMQRILDSTSPVPLDAFEPQAILAGFPRAGSRALAAMAGAEVGVWVMTEGTATDVEVDEVFVVLEGAATVKFEDGDVIDLRPGSIVRLRAGDKTMWTVRSTLRKIYFTGMGI